MYFILYDMIKFNKTLLDIKKYINKNINMASHSVIQFPMLIIMGDLP